MTDLWYYAEGEQARGPLSLTELVPLLTRIPDPRRVMIWRQDFIDWKPVEEVREVAQEVFRPPPLNKAPPPPVADAAAPIREPAVNVDDAAAFKNVKPELTGLGGWLALIAFGQVVGILRFVVELGKYYQALQPQVWTQFPTAMWGETALNAGLMWLFVYTTVLMFRHSQHFPRFFIAQFVAVICTPFIANLWAGLTLGLATGKPMTEFMSMDIKEVGQLIASMIGAAIWIPYILRSQRVRNTFVK